MRMILIHGINQQGKSADLIHEEWVHALDKNFARQGTNPLEKLTRIEAAFYGDLLFDLSTTKVKANAIAQGAEEAPSDFDEFAIDALREMALRMGATEQDIKDQMESTEVPMGAGPHKKWLKAIARVIERISPLRGTLALRVLGQAHAYIRNPYVKAQVDNAVRPVFEDDEPAIVVSHSLGTIVSYSLLREFAERDSPRECSLYITLGSPLGIDSVRKGFPKPRIKPANCLRWFNGADPEDFVALRPELTSTNFGPGIENYPDFENGHADPHSIEAYLSDPRVAQTIAQSIP